MMKKRGLVNLDNGDAFLSQRADFLFQQVGVRGNPARDFFKRLGNGARKVGLGNLDWPHGSKHAVRAKSPGVTDFVEDHRVFPLRLGRGQGNRVMKTGVKKSAERSDSNA